MENHGKNWIHLGHTISIDKNAKTAVVKWEVILKKDTDHLGDCKKYNKLDVIPRKRKSTDFFCVISQTKRGKPMSWPNEKHVFFNVNLSKLCTQGAIQNLPNTLHFSTEGMNIFWELAPSDFLTLMKSLNESHVLKAFFKPSLGIDLIQKCLWILHKKFNFQTTKTEHQAFSVFEALIESKVVVWREMVINHKSMYTHPLTKDSLMQICGVNTTFYQICCGYGILPSKICKALQANQNIQDWGTEEYFKQRELY